MRNGVNLLAVFSFALLSWTMAAAEGNHKDGYSFKDGKVVMMKDGKESPVTAEVKLENGSQLLPDGAIIEKGGERKHLKDGQWLNMNGDFVVANATGDVDSYYLEEGRLYVVRDNTPTLVMVEVTLTDGSRLSPDGTIVQKDGAHARLVAGQRISKEGKTVEGKGNALNGKNAAPSTPIDASHKVENTTKSGQPAEQDKDEKK